MSLGGRILVFVLIAGPLAAGAGLLAAANAWTRGGTVSVDVVESGGADVHVALPAVMAGVAAALVPDELLREAAEEAGPFLPALASAWDELGNCPDFVLVEVLSGDERVRVMKRGRRLVLDVHSDGADIRVAIPLRTVETVIGRLERAI